MGNFSIAKGLRSNLGNLGLETVVLSVSIWIPVVALPPYHCTVNAFNLDVEECGGLDSNVDKALGVMH
jgi:hypothetical protein